MAIDAEAVRRRQEADSNVLLQLYMAASRLRDESYNLVRELYVVLYCVS